MVLSVVAWRGAEGGIPWFSGLPRRDRDPCIVSPWYELPLVRSGGGTHLRVKSLLDAMTLTWIRTQRSSLPMTQWISSCPVTLI